MKKRLYLVAILISVLLSSCSLYETYTSKTLEIYGAGVIQKPLLVDLDVKETKVTGIATARNGTPIETVKQDAVADVLKKEKADVLVEPKFETETSHGNITAIVTGFPATYKNFRPITEEDIHLLQVGVTQKANVYESAKRKHEK